LGSIASAALLSENGDNSDPPLDAPPPGGSSAGAGASDGSHGSGGAALVGRRVLVDFVSESGSTTGYAGTISAFDSACGMHLVQWDAGAFAPTPLHLCIEQSRSNADSTLSDGNADSGPKLQERRFGHAAGQPLLVTFLDNDDARAQEAVVTPSSFPKVALLSTYLGHDWPQRFGPPLLSMSIYANIQGLLSSMLTLAHVNTIPAESVGVFLRTFPKTIHATGYMLIPSVATLGLGLVASTAMHSGSEENAMIALGCLGAVGASVMWSTLSMHFLGLRIRKAALTSQVMSQAAMRRAQRQMRTASPGDAAGRGGAVARNAAAKRFGR